MDNYKFNYIITIHNKEQLIEQVLSAVIRCCGNNSFIYPVLDGCTDNTEIIIDKLIAQSTVPIIKVFANNVHEILSINEGLKRADQNGKGFNLLLQDDVIINDYDIESKIIRIYEHLGYKSIGVLAFRHGVNVQLIDKTKELENIEMIESWYGHGMIESVLPPGYIVKRMVGVRSPECISFEAIKRVGIMDENLAPYTYDNHDFSIRCLQNGFENYVFAINYTSDIKWGGMRVNPHPEAQAVILRNRRYLYQKHFMFLESFDYKKYSPKYSKPFKIPGITPAHQKGIFLRVVNSNIKILIKKIIDKINSLGYKIESNHKKYN